MKVYHSLDFSSSKSRIEPNVAGEYIVHAEDYESINELVRRSVRTRTPLALDGQKNRLYDDFLDDVQSEFDNLDNNPTQEDLKSQTGESTTPMPERSEGQGVDLSPVQDLGLPSE